MAAVVEGHPPQQVGLLAGSSEQTSAGIGVRIDVVQQGQHVAGDVLGEGTAGVTTAAHHVSLLIDGERVPDGGNLHLPDPPTGTSTGGVQGGQQPVAAGGDGCGSDEGGVAQEVAAVHVTPPEIGNRRHGRSQTRLVGQPDIRVGTGCQTDVLRVERVAEVLAEQLAQDGGNRRLGLLTGEPRPHAAGVGVEVETPRLSAAVDPPGQLLARPPGPRPHPLQVAVRRPWRGHPHHPKLPPHPLPDLPRERFADACQ